LLSEDVGLFHISLLNLLLLGKWQQLCLIVSVPFKSFFGYFFQKFLSFILWNFLLSYSFFVGEFWSEFLCLSLLLFLLSFDSLSIFLIFLEIVFFVLSWGGLIFRQIVEFFLVLFGKILNVMLFFLQMRRKEFVEFLFIFVNIVSVDISFWSLLFLKIVEFYQFSFGRNDYFEIISLGDVYTYELSSVYNIHGILRLGWIKKYTALNFDW